MIYPCEQFDYKTTVEDALKKHHQSVHVGNNHSRQECVFSNLHTRAPLIDIISQYMKVNNIIVNNVTLKHLGKIV